MKEEMHRKRPSAIGYDYGHATMCGKILDGYRNITSLNSKVTCEKCLDRIKNINERIINEYWARRMS